MTKNLMNPKKCLHKLLCIFYPNNFRVLSFFFIECDIFLSLRLFICLSPCQFFLLVLLCGCINLYFYSTLLFHGHLVFFLTILRYELWFFEASKNSSFSWQPWNLQFSRVYVAYKRNFANFVGCGNFLKRKCLLAREGEN